MPKVKKVQKAQTGWMGKTAPKGKVYTETGRLVSKKEQDDWNKKVTKSMNEQYFSRPENKKLQKPASKKKMGGKLAKQAATAIAMKKKGIKPKKSK